MLRPAKHTYTHTGTHTRTPARAHARAPHAHAEITPARARAHARPQSTLLKALGGLVTPSAGSFSSDQPTGFVFQNPDHQVVMPTVAADVAFGLGRWGGRGGRRPQL